MKPWIIGIRDTLFWICADITRWRYKADGIKYSLLELSWQHHHDPIVFGAIIEFFQTVVNFQLCEKDIRLFWSICWYSLMIQTYMFKLLPILRLFVRGLSVLIKNKRFNYSMVLHGKLELFSIKNFASHLYMCTDFQFKLLLRGLICTFSMMRNCNRNFIFKT